MDENFYALAPHPTTFGVEKLFSALGKLFFWSAWLSKWAECIVNTIILGVEGKEKSVEVSQENSWKRYKFWCCEGEGTSAVRWTWATKRVTSKHLTYLINFLFDYSEWCEWMIFGCCSCFTSHELHCLALTLMLPYHHPRPIHESKLSFDRQRRIFENFIFMASLTLHSHHICFELVKWALVDAGVKDVENYF